MDLDTQRDELEAALLELLAKSFDGASLGDVRDAARRVARAALPARETSAGYEALRRDGEKLRALLSAARSDARVLAHAAHHGRVAPPDVVERALLYPVSP